MILVTFFVAAFIVVVLLVVMWALGFFSRPRPPRLYSEPIPPAWDDSDLEHEEAIQRAWNAYPTPAAPATTMPRVTRPRKPLVGVNRPSARARQQAAREAQELTDENLRSHLADWQRSLDL